jgi:hypothetical protein
MTSCSRDSRGAQVDVNLEETVHGSLVRMTELVDSSLDELTKNAAGSQLGADAAPLVGQEAAHVDFAW